MSEKVLLNLVHSTKHALVCLSVHFVAAIMHRTRWIYLIQCGHFQFVIQLYILSAKKELKATLTNVWPAEGADPSL